MRHRTIQSLGTRTSGLAHFPLLRALALAFPMLLLLVSAHRGAARTTAIHDTQLPIESMPSGTAPVLIRLREQAILSSTVKFTSKAERGTYVYDRLAEVADRTQPQLVRWLESRGVTVARLTLINAVMAEVSEDTIRALSQRTDVAAVTLIPQSHLHSPDPPTTRVTQLLRPSGIFVDSALQFRVAEGLKRIGVPEAWDRGYKGQGAVVGIIDTGVVHDHRALNVAYRGPSSGRPGSHHDYHWLDPSGDETAPYDSHGHGTFVAGIAVGGNDDSGRSIGVAPRAKFIACRKSGSGAIRCLDWMLAPTRADRSEPRPDLAPDVVNASWSYGRPGACDETDPFALDMNLMVESLNAAGILVVSSAGNSGGCGTICPPGSPPVAIAVGNYDIVEDEISSSSSGGPAMFSGREILKPDLSAPGVDTLSADIPEGFRLGGGTSAAAPHVAGAAAVLLSARPDLHGRPSELKHILLSSVERFSSDRVCPGADSSFDYAAGRGLLRIDRAIDMALAPTATLSATATPSATATATPTTPSPIPPTATPTPSPTVTATARPSAMPSEVAPTTEIVPDLYVPYTMKQPSQDAYVRLFSRVAIFPRFDHASIRTGGAR